MLTLIRQRLPILVVLLGLVLLFQGGGALLYHQVLDADPDALVVRLFNGDARHALIHVVWGVAIIGITWRLGRDPRVPALLAVLFGGFYALLGIAGLFSSEPFGMPMRPEETGFHLIAGPLLLVVGLMAARFDMYWTRPSVASPDIQRT